MKRPIAISLSPNVEKDDVVLAIKTLFFPIRWYDFRLTEKLEKDFAGMFGRDFKALAVNSGRSAEYLILKALGVTDGDEVAIQAFTCVAVPNSIRWLGAKPVFVDVDKTFNIDIKDLAKKVNEKTKAVIVQHTFGIPASMDAIKKTIRQAKKGGAKKNIAIIEDCAVSLGAKYKKRKVGTLGDVSFFSFGRDKVVSSVFGGMILTKDKRLYELLKIKRDRLIYPSPFWTIQQLLHPIMFQLVLSLYNIGVGKFTLGKMTLFALQRIGILSRAVCKAEKIGSQPKRFPQKMPGALAILALNQLGKLKRFNSHRRKIAEVYFRKLKGSKFTLPSKAPGSIWLRYPVLARNALEIENYTKKKGVLLGDWYRKPVVPISDPYLVGYIKDSCPNAEKYSQEIINLPTYSGLTKKDAELVVSLIKDVKV
jgi:dTDP-4-amino-4,6-dideoxygalactose transaminase